MTTHTTTLSNSELQPKVYLSLKPKPLDPKSHLQLILKKANELTSGLSQKQKEEIFAIIRQWEELFFKTYDMNSPLDQEREKAAHALLFFRSNNIEYILHHYAEGPLEQIKWLQLYNDLKEVVGAILPQNIDIEKFVKENQERQLDFKRRFLLQKSVEEVKEIAKKTFEQMELYLRNHIDKINQDLKTEFETIKKKIQQKSQNSDLAMNKLHDEVEQLTETILKIGQEVMQQLQASKLLSQELQKEKNESLSFITSFENQIDKFQGEI